jgi:hypothetical protein
MQRLAASHLQASDCHIFAVDGPEWDFAAALCLADIPSTHVAGIAHGTV